MRRHTAEHLEVRVTDPARLYELILAGTRSRSATKFRSGRPASRYSPDRRSRTTRPVER
jgi:hypothetical protein